MRRTIDRVRLALGGVKNSRTAGDIALLERLFMRGVQEIGLDGYDFSQLDAEDVDANTEKNSSYWINPDFEKEYAAWDKKSTGGYFWVGSTSDALKSVGITPSMIYWDKSKILNILSNPTHHMENSITQVPKILEDPMLILQSVTEINRVVIYGELYDDLGNPVLCALELTPNGSIQNFIKIASAYGKESGLQKQINESPILYINPDKKRTDSWFQTRRLQLPVGVTNYGPIGKITLLKRNVKGEIELGGEKVSKTPMQIAFEKAQKGLTDNYDMQNGEKNSQFSFESELPDVDDAIAEVEEKVAANKAKKQTRSAELRDQYAVFKKSVSTDTIFRRRREQNRG